ncbi:IS66 family insertion sequence element accessory protein TnpB, partial [Rhodobacter capsulatus]|uniref:IS66 family insertion sequence element accessory protein TnpB n=1 Tax=Rhodobacter capsulatus TaxID=1061 RepID=UPI00373FD631
ERSAPAWDRGAIGLGTCAVDPGSGRRMIGPGNGVRVFLAAGTTDMRCGIAGLCARAKKVLGEDPAGGALLVFRGRMGDRLKILHWDGQGFCLYYKVLERGHFPWPKAAEGKIALTPAQMAMLWEGIDWRQPRWTSAPTRM